MPERDNNKTFIDEKFSKTPKKKNETNKKIYIQIDEICSIDIVDMSGYKISNIIFHYNQ